MSNGDEGKIGCGAVTVIMIGLLFLCFWGGIWAVSASDQWGRESVNKQWQDSMVEKGYAEWRINSQTGESSYVFLTPEEQIAKRTEKEEVNVQPSTK